MISLKKKFFIHFLVICFLLQVFNLPLFAQSQNENKVKLPSIEKGVESLVVEISQSIPAAINSVAILTAKGIDAKQYDRDFVQNLIYKELKKTNRYENVVSNQTLRQTIQYLPIEDIPERRDLSSKRDQQRLGNILGVDAFLYTEGTVEDENTLTITMKITHSKTYNVLYEKELKVRDDIPSRQAKILIGVIGITALAFTLENVFGQGGSYR